MRLSLENRFGEHCNAAMYNSQFLIKNSELSPLGGIRQAGSVINGLGVPKPSRVLNSYSLVLIFGGKGRYTDESGADFPLRPGDVILLDPRIEHWYGPDDGESWDEIFVIFDGPVFDVWFQKHYVDLGLKRLHLNPLSYWIERFVYACGTQHRDDSYEHIKDVLRLQQLLSEIFRATQVNHNQTDSWVDRAKRRLEQHNDSHVAAEKLKMSYETFRKKFKRHQGMAPQQYLTHMTMKEAQKLLDTTDQPIYQIALSLGYCDEFHFSKQFSKFVGCTPSDYRSRLSQ